MTSNIYQALFDLLNTYVYGGTVVAGTYQELVCILVSTAVTLFMISLPFLVVWRFIRLFV